MGFISSYYYNYQTDRRVLTNKLKHRRFNPLFTLLLFQTFKNFLTMIYFSHLNRHRLGKNTNKTMPNIQIMDKKFCFEGKRT